MKWPVTMHSKVTPRVVGSATRHKKLRGKMFPSGKRLNTGGHTWTNLPLSFGSIFLRKPDLQ